jgi:hypothetical protein
MELGLNAIPKPQDEWFWRDLGVTWAKWSADVDQPDMQDDRARLEYAASLGLRAVIDLRTSSEWMNRRGIEAWERLAAAGQVAALPEGGSFEEQDRVIRANQLATHKEVLQHIAAAVQRHVAAHKDFCQDWEWWGEWDCPVTSKGIFHVICYPETLRTVYRAIKEVQPEARVWTGGNGMDLNDGWVVGLRQDEALKSFDVLNWHPYPMSLRNRHKIEERLEQNYTGWRTILNTEACASRWQRRNGATPAYGV